LLEIAGEAGTGKTNFCISLMLKCILPKRLNGLEQNALFITTVKKVSLQRIEKIIDLNIDLTNKERKEVYRRINNQHFDPDEYNAFFITIDDYIFKNKIKMVIIDSFAGLADVQFIKDNNEVDYRNRTIFLRT
jgi:RecA/RadA recombinase